MPDDSPNPVLRAWLDTATEGLCDVAKARVSNEIRVHYGEAVAAEIALGREENDARRFAVAALGDAEKARKAFSKTYLTEKEAKTLVSIPWTRRSIELGLYLYVGWASLGIAVLGAVDAVQGFVLGFSPGGYGRAISTLCMGVGWFVVWILRPRLAGERKWRRSLVWQNAGITLMSLSLWFYGVAKWISKGEPVDAVLAVASLALALVIVPLLFSVVVTSVRILRKLSRNTALYDSFLNSNDDGGRYA